MRVGVPKGRCREGRGFNTGCVPGVVVVVVVGGGVPLFFSCNGDCMMGDCKSVRERETGVWREGELLEMEQEEVEEEEGLGFGWCGEDI